MPSTTLVRSRLPLWLLPLALAACEGKSPKAQGGEAGKPASADAKKADAKKADAKKADAKQAGAKKADGKQAKAQAKPRSGRTFKKGRPIPPGLSPEDVAAYNRAQGDPKADGFTLEDAFAGDATLADRKAGKLTANFDTTMGSFSCELFEEDTPNTVANFVGLARGTRPWYDKKKDEWVTRPFFDGLLFHRVIRNFMIQTGDPLGSGTGGPGYHIVDEPVPKLRHTGPGILSMANRGPNTGSSQFFVTVRATPHLDGKHTIFGRCAPKVPVAISKVKTDRRWDRPIEPVKIKKVTITREPRGGKKPGKKPAK